VPIFIVLAALTLDPALGGLLNAEDARDMQRILPTFILERTPSGSRCCFSARCSRHPLDREWGDHRADLALHREHHQAALSAHERPSSCLRCASSS